jgi:membrane protease YdiL (CAAX protease family)
VSTTVPAQPITPVSRSNVAATGRQGAASYGLAITVVLIVSRFSCSWLIGSHAAHLMRTNQFALSHFYLDYSDVGLSIVILVELLLAYLILHPSPSQEGDGRRNDSPLTKVLIVAIGISLSALAVLFTPIQLQPFMLANLVIDNLIFSPKILIPTALVIALPFLAEVVFRRIVLSAWRMKIGTPLAILATSVAFALSWPLTGAPSALCIGLTSGLLFVRSQSIFPAVFANFLATLSCIALLVWRVIAGGYSH